MSNQKSENIFGPNTWLIDEMYQQFLENPESISDGWRDFFADYSTGTGRTVSTPKTQPQQEKKQASKPENAELLKGFAARIVENMEESLTVPTATSTRIVPVKLMEENRRLINQFLQDRTGGKVSFTHLIAWAIIKALESQPALQNSFREIDGQPHKIQSANVNFGLAVDLVRKDGSRSLLVPNIKNAEKMDFDRFFAAYNDIIRKVKKNQIEPDDFAGTTISLTNPGMIGTVHSVPRLMSGQSAIIATGAIDYPAEYQAADPRIISRLGVSKVMMMTCTYDHRVIQGAESGLFLQKIQQLLNGEEDFYRDIFLSLSIPYEPLRLSPDHNTPLDFQSGDDLIEKQSRVLQLINMYRVRGHLLADTNPLSTEMKSHPELNPELYGLTIWDYDRDFNTLGLASFRKLALRKILDILREAYCRTIGVEYMHIQDPEQKLWIQQNVEGVSRADWFGVEIKKRILYKLNEAEAFEKFLHTKYVGHKRFSLEGAETLIPLLDHLFNIAAESGIEESVIGMAHRGRLNVLANIVGKSYEKIFREFGGDIDPTTEQGSGDVKYHLGAEGSHKTPKGKFLKISLASNPSHLEAVDPVVEGMVRAKQDIAGDREHTRILPVLIHGDAAFAGQGVVAETFNLSALSGYRTGGTVHIVVNNIIGFTTGPRDARSSVYATDVAKIVQAPIFHVNGDDPEACVRVIGLAYEFRQKFQKDVVVDMVCYRRHGHNEGDEPSFTQPVMYSKINDRRSVRKLYTEILVNRGDLSLEEAEAALNEYNKILEGAFTRTEDSAPPEFPEPKDIGPAKAVDVTATEISPDVQENIVNALADIPSNFNVHPKLQKQLFQRKKAFESDKIDWALGEALAFGSLLMEGHAVRLSGQDSRRGTFSQRHAVLVDFKTMEEYTPLNNITMGQAQFMPFDSLLSEFAVLGFEYGYSVIRKDALVLWEAQFGDFVNGGQIIIDQFISSADDKWGQTSRLVMLLPHGFEGQGPEHSSARMERFLTLAAEDNFRVTYPTSSAQYFHLLRSQMKMEKARPLIVMTPKSLLRAEVAKSGKQEFGSGRFNMVLDDPQPPENPDILLFCTGKVAFDLMDYRDQKEIKNTSVVRLEQLYPFPADKIREILEKYKSAKIIRWVQEEPRNMGAWNYVLGNMQQIFDGRIRLEYAGRFQSASPAAGSFQMHTSELNQLLRTAFSLED